MRARIAAITMLAFLMGVAAVATRGDAAPTRQWAVTWLSKPTLVGGTIVQGPVMFVHDEIAMQRGEPCTRVYLFEPKGGPTEQVAAFHCIPIKRHAPRAFTITTRPNSEIGYGCVLTEYQFAGDTEAHGVPVWDLAD